MQNKLVLGSGSLRRRELLASLVGAENFIVDPPAGFIEPRCDSASSLREVVDFVDRLAREKGEAVARQRQDSLPIISADTVVVARPSDSPVVLGKPPASDWEDVVRGWWETLLSGRTHVVLTGVALTLLNAGSLLVESAVVQSAVTFREIDPKLGDWYLSTGESVGKAGGYAIQGLGGELVERVEGSLSNVVGLPLWETRKLLEQGLGGDLSRFGIPGSCDVDRS